MDKYLIGCDWKYIRLPKTDSNKEWLEWIDDTDRYDNINNLLRDLLELDGNIKYSSMPLYDIEAIILTRDGFDFGGSEGDDV